MLTGFVKLRVTTIAVPDTWSPLMLLSAPVATREVLEKSGGYSCQVSPVISMYLQLSAQTSTNKQNPGLNAVSSGLPRLSGKQRRHLPVHYLSRHLPVHFHLSILCTRCAYSDRQVGMSEPLSSVINRRIDPAGFTR